MVESNTHEYILSDFSQPSCSELNFSVAAFSLKYGESEYSITNKQFGSGSNIYVSFINKNVIMLGY